MQPVEKDLALLFLQIGLFLEDLFSPRIQYNTKMYHIFRVCDFAIVGSRNTNDAAYMYITTFHDYYPHCIKYLICLPYLIIK
jgi:hypothetical protein